MPASAASLLVTVSVVAMVAGSARADCSPAGTAGADAVTCDSTGADNTPYSSLGGDDTIDVVSGTFGDEISGGADNDTLNLDGTADADSLAGGTGDDEINLLAGTVADVFGNAGADTITLNGATVSNNIDGGGGADTIDLLSGSAINAIGGAGNDTLTLDGATLTGNVTAGDGDDTIDLLSGSAVSAVGGAGVDTITLDGATIGVNIVGGDGGDTIDLLSGTSGAVNGDAGNDAITLNGATITGNVLGGIGDDTIDLSAGSTGGSVFGEEGNDTITLDGATIGANIEGNAGNDVIQLLSGTVTVDVTGNAGTDTIVLNGASVNDDILGGADNDTINLLSGTVSDDVFGNAGSDAITLNGATIGDDLFAGSGSDTVTVLSGTVTDDLFGESGGDSIFLLGGDIGDDVFGGSGADVISLSGTTVGGDVFGESGGDIITLNGSSVAGDLSGATGDDSFSLLSGSFGGSLLGGDGSDSALVGAAYDLSTIAGNLDGGDDTSTADGFIDVLNIETGGTLAGGQVLNWEIINLDPDTPLTLTGTVATSSDPGHGMFLNTGTLAITSLDITGNFTNSSLVDMTGNAATGDTLTVSNDYFGGGTLALDAALDATLASDMLVVDGDIGGVTSLAITDLGGDPTFTGSGPGNGIPLVDNSIGGDLADGDFVLPGGEIVKSPFTYTLSAETDDILYLQSSVLGQVYGYAILHEFMREEFPILRDRLGDRRYLGIDSGEPERTFDHNAGVWVRLDGRRREIDNDDGDAFTTSEWDQTRGEFELGIDIPAFGGSVGVFSFGMHGVKSTADATGPGSSDTAELDGYGFGANLGLTYFPGGGFYADLQGRVTAWDTDIEVDSRSLDEDTDAISWGASLEVGNRMKLGGSTMLIPRGRAVYTDVRFDEFTDSDGVAVDSEDGDSLTLEAGMALETVFRGSGVSLFADASVSHDVLGDSSVTASGMEFESGLEDTWGEVALGVTVPVGEGTAAFAKADVSTPLGDSFTDSYGYGVQLGVRMDF